MDCLLEADCSNCNNNHWGCSGECAYRTVDDVCTILPSYDNDCSVFDGMHMRCDDQNPNCSYNLSTDKCLDVPNYNGDCSVYN